MIGALLARRVVGLVFVVWAASLVVFLALTLVPGDPAILMLGQDATPEKVIELRQRLGLDQPVWRQYLDFMAALLRGDLGTSYQQGQSVSGEIARAFPVTVALSTTAMILSVVVGVGLGIISAVRANTWVDNVLRVTLLASTSVPIYVLGLVLIYALSVNGPHLPSFGWGSPSNLILPAVTLATFPLALIGRLTRTTVLDVLGEDYLNTARAKGLPERTVVMRHALRNALLPVITVVGLQFGILLAGAVLTESIFSVPGMGLLLLNAVLARDYAMIRGAVLVASIVIALLNLLVDLFYVVVDPRIRYT